IVAGFNDTIMIVDAKKTYGDNSPREIFKWPVKFRKNSDSPNAKRADPNIRYEWQVRCECGHDGFGPESPWSDVKIFNTPDFDPETGIFSLPPGAFSDDELKTLAEMNLLLMPNPASHHLRIQNADGLPESFDWIIMDMTGRVMDKGAVRKNKSSYLELDVSVLAQGSYHIMVVGTQYSASSPFLIKR
ncbi:MAG: T9SS type A sorting domain-containing protein, partial [Flavobacteriales bacterium]|nr:T9SS type A sorting domain-containing protein [Flavobacteriales bacterium]